MTNQPKKQVDPKPYEKHACQGRYMETGQPWAGGDGREPVHDV